jgi:hypothetical protein
MLLFDLVICVLMLNLVLTNCYVMHYNIRKVILMQGYARHSGNDNHPVISTGKTFQLNNPASFLHPLLHQPVY